MMSARPFAAALLALVLASAPLAAQVPLTPRGLGMGGALLGAARGHDALFLNPANLALPGTPHWSVAIPQLTLAGTATGLDVGDLRDLVRWDELSDARLDEIFAAVPDAGLAARFDVRAPLVAFQTRRLAFGLAYGTVGEHALGRDIVELAFYGYEPGRFDYRAGDSAGWRMSFWDFAVAWAEQREAFSWGVTAHYLRGGTLLRSWVAEPRYDPDGRDIEVDYVAVFSRGGRGWALDVGAAYEPRPGVTVSAALANARASLRWSDELYVRSVHLDRRDFDDPDPGGLLDRYGESERRLGPEDAELTRGLTAADLRERADLPTRARLGVAWQAAPGTELGATYERAFGSGPLGGSWDRMLAFGAQQRLPVVTLRAGLARDLRGGGLLSGGFSLGPLELALGRLSDGEVDGVPRRGWIGALGLSTRSRSIAY